MATGWTDERVETLLKMNAEGYSNRQIGAFLGVTRNAVIGKLCRLGIVKTTKPSTKSIARATTDHRYQQRDLDKRIKALRTIAAQMKTGEVVKEEDAPEPRCLELVDLENRDCRWIVTDASPWPYCAHKAAPGSAYCGYHARKLVPSKPAPKRVVKPFRRAA